MTATVEPTVPGVPEVPEVVVLLDADGHAIGTAPKSTVHTAATPLHLAFSCYLFDNTGRLLLTRRALDKATFPGLWTNTACGHPAPGEAGALAAVRRVQAELGAQIHSPRLVLPQFRYRAEMDGVEEHEWCPVYVAVVPADLALAPDPTEVADARWTPWHQIVEQVFAGESRLSPWCQAQIRQLAALGTEPNGWPDGDPTLLPPALTA